MSTTAVSSSTSSSSSSTASTGLDLTSLGTGAPQQITGLASGLNTDEIITEEMSIYQQPVTNLQNQENGLTAQNTELSKIQSELQTLESDAQAVADPGLFADSQTATSTDPSLVTATTTSATGAVVGGYQVAVNALATSAQKTFTYTPPAQADTVTIDNQTVPLAANATAQDFANAVNNSGNLDVWASVNSSGSVTLSDRATGQQTGSYITVSDTLGQQPGQTAALTNPTAANPGQNASLTVNGQAVTSASNTVTTAIAGVSLALNGVTPSGSPVTINVSAPGPSTANITAAVNTFITQYNSVISDIQTQLSTPPSSTDPTVGTLYQDPELSDLLTAMRSSMYTNVAGSSSSAVQSMLDIGVSTGATTGSGAVSQSALAGDLVLDSGTLESALQSDPLGVQQMMVAWGASFSTLVGATADPGGSIDTRIQGDDQQITQLGNQITTMQGALADKQSQLVQQFAQLESTLSQNQSQSSWLTSQIAALPS